MTNLQNAIAAIQNLDSYLAGFSRTERPARFEHLSCKSFGYFLKLPFFDQETDDISKQHRVVWHGVERTWTPAPGGADGLVHAYGFWIVIEATLQRGRLQWSQEFVPCVNHYDTFLADAGLRSTDCYLILLVTELNDYTFTSIKQKVTEKCRFVLLPVSAFAGILETYSLAFAATHSDLQVLLQDILDCCERSSDKDDFLQRLEEAIKSWKNELLYKERRAFVGAKSYRSLHKRGGYGSLSQILLDLYNDSVVMDFFTHLGRRLETEDIEKSLEQERLAHKAQNVPGDIIYVRIPFRDVEGRIRVLIKELEDATTG